MKLRYYMRGLGIGIFVTAILMALTIHGKTERLTDEQIIERAEALGMEMKYSSDVLADTVSENAAEDTKPAELPNQVKEETSLANRLAAEEKTENPLLDREAEMLLKRDRQTACNRTSIMKTRMRQNVRKQKRIAVQMRTAQRKAQQRKTQRMRRMKVLQMIQIRQPQQEAANQIHRLQAASRSQSAAVTVLIQWQESCTKPDLSVM